MQNCKKQWIKFLLTVVFSGIICGLFVGCDSGNDARNPIFQRAIKLREEGKYQVAATEFRKFLAARPESAAGHLQLATLYDEALDMPFSAIYHYQEYLRYAPQSAEAATVSRWIEAAEERYFKQLQSKILPMSTDAMQEKIMALEQQAETLLSENTAFREMLDNTKRQLATAEKRSDVLNETVSRERALAEDTISQWQKKVKQLEEQLEEEKEWRTGAEKALEIAARMANAESSPVADMENSAGGQTAVAVPVPPGIAAQQNANQSANADSGDSAVGGENKSEIGVLIPLDQDKKVYALPPQPAGEMQGGNKEVVEAATPEKNTVSQEAVLVKPTDSTMATAQEEVMKDLEPISNSQNNSENSAKVPAPASAPVVYTVKAGDNLSKLARHFYGKSSEYKKILNRNRDILKSENDLKIGQKLYIPRPVIRENMPE